MRPNPPHRHRCAHTAQECPSEERIERITAALESAFLIPPGSHLVPVLGNGSEHCNHDALFTWVSRELDRLETRFSEQQVPLLAEALERRLTLWDLERRRS